MTQRCTYCGARLDLGTDLVATQVGVLGPRGFVPLNDYDLFCSEDCARHHLEPGDERPPRIP